MIYRSHNGLTGQSKEYALRSDGQWFSRRTNGTNGSYTRWIPLPDEWSLILTQQVDPDNPPEVISLKDMKLSRDRKDVRLPR